MSDKYVTCAKCGHDHSVLVPHKCFKTKKKKPPEFDPLDHEDMGKGGKTESLDKHKSENPEQGDGDKGEEGEKGDESDAGDGEEGDGDGDEQDGEGEDGEGRQGEGEGEDEQEAPAPQPPDPSAPPVVIVCTVLKYAALTAQCSKNGVIEVTVNEDGIFVYGHNGDLTAYDTIPWGEFEKRATLDGEFYVKEVIDRVDGQLIEAKAEVLETKPVKEAKAKAKAIRTKAKPKLTVPLYAGQRVMCRDGLVREVVSVDGIGSMATARYMDGDCIWASSGRGNSKPGTDYPVDAISDAPAEDEKPKLTLPLKAGQIIVRRNGSAATVTDDNGDIASLDRGSLLWRRTGRTEGGSDGKANKAESQSDAVADA